MRAHRTPSLHAVDRPTARGFQLKGLEGVAGDDPTLPTLTAPDAP